MQDENKHQKPGQGKTRRDIDLNETNIRSGSFDDDKSVRPDLTTAKKPASDSAESSEGSDE